ncbi:MAG: aspartate--tRNA ligase [Candidatus Omnitrophica bacterium]|nr:aspartate--tRNA ligase [Candidatus Omnitrophota bacterium]
MLRTHYCGELRKKNVGEKVKLVGWVATRRDHGDIIFIDLRDRYGLTQIVFDPARNKEAHENSHALRNEYCVLVHGAVSERPVGTKNEKIPTGEIEIYVEKLEILSESLTLPFEVKDGENVSEEVRLKYRYLDLRRNSMQRKLEMRHKAYKHIINFLDSEKFLYIDTPMLTKSTPEGARDYLVPSRVQQGSFYALPQSPQIFKQILMVSGCERYFQLARCFRDEDLRADRQPEFMQIDIEMSFIDVEDIFDVCERMFKGLYLELLGKELKTPFPRMPHHEAVSRYGCDKPDTRFDVFLHELTEDVKDSEFKVFKNVVASGGKVIALAAPGYKDISRKEIDDLTAFVGEYGAKGLAYFKVEDTGLTSQISKFFNEATLKLFKEKTGAKPGDMIFMVADDKKTAYDAMSALRLKIGRDKNLIDKSRFNFLWIVDFPLFAYNKDEKRWESEHHPFTNFYPEDMAHIDKGDLGKVRSKSYDLVLNGSEIGSGSIRIHRRDVQKKIFDILGITDEECQVKFGFMLEAFQYGPPPHGGVAFGLDRLITLFTGDSSIREVIAFPKNQKGACPLSGAPSMVDEKQLRDLGIKLKPGQSNA